MKVAVTGASGHVGSAVCRNLTSHGYDVVALTRKDVAAIKDLPLATVQGDLSDKNTLLSLMKGCDYAIHAAAAIELGYHFNQSVFDINVTGTKNMLDAALQSGIKKFIHFSSIHAYSHAPHDQPLDEQRTFVSDNAIFYDRTKRDSHQLALATSEKMHVTVVCPTSVVGPPDHKPSKLGKAIVDIYKGYIPAVFKGGFDFADVRDLAAGVISALEKGRSGQTYILGGKYYTIKQFADMVLEIKGSKKRLAELPLTVAKLFLPFIKLYSYLSEKPPLYDKTYLDILQDGNKQVLSTKAQRELGYTVRDLKETLTDTIQWFKDNGKI